MLVVSGGLLPAGLSTVCAKTALPGYIAVPTQLRLVTVHTGRHSAAITQLHVLLLMRYSLVQQLHQTPNMRKGLLSSTAHKHYLCRLAA
jgi:hypothetical protein